MKIEKKLDKILDILYDENLLHWKEIPATDIIAFGKYKFGITWSDSEISFILNILQTDGYIIINKGDLERLQMPTFSLTTKGIQLKSKGGFVRTKLIENLKQYLIFWGSIIALIVSFITIYDFIDTHFLSIGPKKACVYCDNKKSHSDGCDYRKAEKTNSNCSIEEPKINIENNPILINNIGKTDTTITKKYYKKNTGKEKSVRLD